MHLFWGFYYGDAGVVKGYDVLKEGSWLYGQGGRGAMSGYEGWVLLGTTSGTWRGRGFLTTTVNLPTSTTNHCISPS